MKETFKKIWQFTEKRHKNLISAMAFSFFRSFFGATQLLAVIIAVTALIGETEPKTAIIYVSILTAVCVIGNFSLSYFEQINSMESSFYMIADKRISIAERLRRFPLGFFNNKSAGKISATLTTTMSDVETAAVMSMVGIISGLFNTVALLTIIMFYEWRIGLIALLGTAVYLFAVAHQVKLSRKYAPNRQKAQSDLSENAINFFEGIKVTKAYSFKEGDSRLKQSISNSEKENISLTSKSMPSQFFTGLTVGIFESLILVVSLLLFTGTENFGIVKVVVLMIFSFTVYSALNQAGSMLSMIGMLDSGIREVDDIENNPTLTVEEPKETPKSNEIEFQNVNFSYGENEVLHDINIKVKENTLTAIIGPSGSGKTTLCQLIPRMREVSGGKITIGGADIRHIEDSTLMQKISMVFQKVYLFEDTVLNNIRFAKPEATLEEVRAAAKAAHCDDFIMNLKDGYDTMIESGGNSLSGGEKQRISIARAILKDSPIIILDEATGALDTECEHEIMEAIDELTKNKTVIMIAHRLTTVKKADQIISLKDGKVAEQGTAETLMQTDGVYSTFMKARTTAQGWKISN